MHTARHQVVTRTFRSGFGQHWGFDIQETVVIHKAAHEAGDFRTGLQAVRHFRATQVQITEFQPRFFSVDVVRVQRQRFGTVDDGQIGGEDFYRTRCHIFIDVFFITRANGTGDLDA
ncbi:hypothetical protein D3C75_1148080 [compost metagenome]